MSIWKNGKLVAGGRQVAPLLSFMWADHILDDISWLRADTFSWQSGAVYQAVYQHLFNDLSAISIPYYAWTASYFKGNIGGATNSLVYTTTENPTVGDKIYASDLSFSSDITGVNNGVYTYDTGLDLEDTTLTRNSSADMQQEQYQATQQTETIAGVTVTYYLADDGHKICPASEESNVAAIYAATGVAWYYVLDTVNERFKLPRTKFGFTGLRDTVGNYVEPALPNITGSFQKDQIQVQNPNEAVGCVESVTPLQNYNLNTAGSGNVIARVTLNTSKSNAIYQDGATVQPPATQMYLYFYVGEFTQTALENTAGITAETLNDKADADLGNVLANIDFVIESQLPTAENNYTWYRKYRSGWVEQGGYCSGGTTQTPTLPVTMADTNYTVTFGNTSGTYEQVRNTARTTTTITIRNANSGGTVSAYWEVKGMAA